MLFMGHKSDTAVLNCHFDLPFEDICICKDLVNCNNYSRHNNNDISLLQEERHGLLKNYMQCHAMVHPDGDNNHVAYWEPIKYTTCIHNVNHKYTDTPPLTPIVPHTPTITKT